MAPLSPSLCTLRGSSVHHFPLPTPSGSIVKMSQRSCFTTSQSAPFPLPTNNFFCFIFLGSLSFFLFSFLLMELKRLCVIISVLGWLSDKGQGKIIILLITYLCFSLRESFHQLFIVLHTLTLKTSAKILGKYSFHGASQRTLRQLSSLGIRLNSLLLQLHIITNPKSFIRSPSCHSCFSPFQWSFRLNRLNQKIEVGYHVGTQTTVSKCATSRLLINQCVCVSHIYISHVNITCERK